MKQFEIQDDKGVLFSGSLVEVVNIYDILLRIKKKGDKLTEDEQNLILLKMVWESENCFCNTKN